MMNETRRFYRLALNCSRGSNVCMCKNGMDQAHKSLYGNNVKLIAQKYAMCVQLACSSLMFARITQYAHAVLHCRRVNSSK